MPYFDLYLPVLLQIMIIRAAHFDSSLNHHIVVAERSRSR